MYEKLEKLNELKEKGILTEEEFNKEKERILNSPNSETIKNVFNPTSNIDSNGNPIKSKLTAGILALLLGCLGIHNFYLGYTGKAITQLLLTLIGWIIVIGPILSVIWGIIDGILILTENNYKDANGNLLQAF